MKFTTRNALIFCAGMIIIFTVTMIIIFCNYQCIPDALVVAFFSAFSLEGGYCAFIHKIKKEMENKENKPTTIGDITGFDDAEVIDEGE